MPHKTWRRARADYPKGIIGVYDHGKETPYFERYTVVYTPDTYTPEGGRPEEWFSYAYISEDGEGSHGECRGWERPRATWGGNHGSGKTIAFEALPPEVRAFVERDLLPYCYECGNPMQVDGHGITNHLTADGGIDYDRDAQHTPYAELG